MATLNAPTAVIAPAIPPVKLPWTVFDEYAHQYDAWFNRHGAVYVSELQAVKALLPPTPRALEIGVGTARFAGPLGIPWGIEPAPAMARIARARGVQVVRGVAEALPLVSRSCEAVLFVTTLSFLPDVRAALAEARRVLRPKGTLVMAEIDRSSYWGRRQETRKTESVFYRQARLRSADAWATLVGRAGFEDLRCVQTVFHDPERMRQSDPVKPGYGDGLFVVFSGIKAA